MALLRVITDRRRRKPVSTPLPKPARRRWRIWNTARRHSQTHARLESSRWMPARRRWSSARPSWRGAAGSWPRHRPKCRSHDARHPPDHCQRQPADQALPGAAAAAGEAGRVSAETQAELAYELEAEFDRAWGQQGW